MNIPDEVVLRDALAASTGEAVRVALRIVDDRHLAMTVAWKRARFDMQRALQIALTAIGLVNEILSISEIRGLPADQWPPLPEPPAAWKRHSERLAVGRRFRPQPSLFEAAIEEIGPNCRRWNWIVRLQSPIPSANDLGVLLRSIRRHFKTAMIEMARQMHGSWDNPIPGEIHIRRIDEAHLLVDVTWPPAGKDPLEMWASGNATLLLCIDSTIGIEDIQGIPKRYWFFLNQDDARN